MDKARVDQAKAFIFADIKRELALANASERLLGRLFLHLARVPRGGGNFVAALSLLAYTEYAGRLKTNDFSNEKSRQHFNDFFGDLGTGYKELLSQHDIYKIFRCGLAHEYYVKKECTIYMLASQQPLNAGIVHDGRHFSFVVERYFQDFTNAFEALCANLTK